MPKDSNGADKKTNFYDVGGDCFGLPVRPDVAYPIYLYGLWGEHAMSDVGSSNEPGLRARLQYRFDRTIAGGTAGLMLWLAAISGAMVAFAAVGLSMGIHPEGQQSDGYIESFWTTLNVALDPGAVEEAGWPYRALMLSVAILGVLIVSTIIGVLTAGIEGKLEELRRGRSLVLEEDHTIILGWSSKIAAAVQELVIANESRQRAVVVVLADRDKVEMEEYFADRVPEMMTTEVICRRGDPCDLADLAIVRPEKARSILLFSGECEDGDAAVLKRSLALNRIAEQTGKRCPVIAEVSDHENGEAVARIGDVSIVEPAQLVTRVLLQAARQPGLSLVYDEILSFEGCEIYFHGDDVLTGRTYRDAAMSFPAAAVIGLVPKDGVPELNPSNDQVLQAGDELIVVALDDSDIANPLATPMTYGQEHISAPSIDEPTPEKYLVLGWHEWAPILLTELDEHLPRGSSLHVGYDPVYTDGPSEAFLRSLEHLAISAGPLNTGRRSELTELGRFSVDEVVVLAYRDRLNAQDADSRTLLTLVHLRELIANAGRPIGIASELLDARNRALANRGREDDFIASEELVSNVMVQLSENPQLGGVLDELLTADGSEMYLRLASDYVSLDTPVPFGAIVQEGLNRNEAVIGILDRDISRRIPDIRLSLPKDELVTLGADDAIVVVAED